MSASPRFLVTGGTGFLGQYVVRGLKKIGQVDVLSRSPGSAIQGDLRRWKGGLEDQLLQPGKYAALVHLAGLYNLSAGSAETYLQNVHGTHVALQIAAEAQIPVFLNASSIAAVSNFQSSRVGPNDLDLDSNFPDAYSRSKAQAEQLVRNFMGSSPLRVNLRLGVLVGESEKGQIQRIDGPYEVAERIRSLRPWLAKWPWVLPVPGHPQARLPLVPVDQAAQALVKICQHALSVDQTGFQSYHLVPEEGVTIQKLYQSLFSHFGLGHVPLHFLEKVPDAAMIKMGSFALNLPEEQLRYAMGLPEFDRTTTQNVLGTDWCSEFEDYESQFWRGYEDFLSNR
ncbi:MAG: SDR family oxidoreductase [Bdellovibrionales bacterium]